MPRIPVQLVGIRNLCDTAHYELRGKVKHLTRRLIGEFVDDELTDRLGRTDHLTDGVVQGIRGRKGAPKPGGLLWHGKQLQLDGMSHLAALLLRNVVLDCFRRDAPGAADLVRTTPERWQART